MDTIVEDEEIFSQQYESRIMRELLGVEKQRDFESQK